MKTLRPIALAGLVLLLAPSVADLSARRSSAEMTRAATEFLGGLTAEQRAKAQFELTDPERFNWFYTPVARQGLPLKEMTEPQRALAHRLLETGISEAGKSKVTTVMELELILRELEQDPVRRDPELYYFSIFGTPSASSPWGWRMEGHHLSLNYTVLEGKPVAAAPVFFGANPAEVRSGNRQGLRALGPEEDLGRELIRSMDAQQREIALINVQAPNDIVTRNTAEVNPLEPVGIPITRLRPEQSALLMRLINEYLSRMADDIAAARRTRLEQSDFSSVTFAWAGSLEPGQPHYYRVQGPTFLIEFDNVQTNANHIHSVWRDFNGDFGRDLLREHYAAAPHPH